MCAQFRDLAEAFESATDQYTEVLRQQLPQVVQEMFLAVLGRVNALPYLVTTTNENLSNLMTDLYAHMYAEMERLLDPPPQHGRLVNPTGPLARPEEACTQALRRRMHNQLLKAVRAAILTQEMEGASATAVLAELGIRLTRDMGPPAKRPMVVDLTRELGCLRTLAAVNAAADAVHSFVLRMQTRDSSLQETPTTKAPPRQASTVTTRRCQ